MGRKPKKNKDKRGRRARGTGSIFFSQSRNCWVGRHPVGVTASGHTRYQTVTGPTQAIVLARLAALAPPGPRTTVGEWCARWLEHLDVRPRTRDSYTQSVRDYIVPTLGHLPVATLTPQQIEHAARQWQEQLSANTTLLALAHLHTAIRAAMRAGLRTDNPVALAKKPRATKAKFTPFSPEEMTRIVAGASEREGTWLVALLAAAGLRVMEAAALEVTDWDAATQTIAITKTAGPRGIGPPKSSNGVRTIRVPSPAVPAVTAAAGKRTSGYLFPSESAGGWKAHNTIRAPYLRLLKRLGIPFRRLHVLRHSAITHALAAGMPIGDVARYFGDSPATIVKVYLHATGRDVAGAIEGLLGAGEVTEPPRKAKKRRDS
jgi:integrase